jgi:hypothetical protein
LKPDPDSPDFLEFERGFLTNKFALVPRSRNTPNFKLIHSRLLKFEEPQPDVILSVVARCGREAHIGDGFVDVANAKERRSSRENYAKVFG